MTKQRKQKQTKKHPEQTTNVSPKKMKSHYFPTQEHGYYGDYIEQ